MVHPKVVLWEPRNFKCILEADFIHSILLGGATAVVSDRLPFADDVIYASFNTDAADRLREARGQGYKNIGLLHLADEQGTDDRGFYANADYVLRHYWHPPFDPKVLWIPLGTSNGMGGSAEKTRIGFFAGWVDGRPEREAMRQTVFEHHLPFELISTDGFARGMSRSLYNERMKSSWFALCPGGNTPETTRLYDACACGCIPVTLQSRFLVDGLGNPPFVILNDWSQLPNVFQQMLSEKEWRQQEVIEWWDGFKQDQNERVRQHIHETS